MNTRVLLASAIVLGSLISAANAMSVVNEDNKAYTLKITPKGGKQIDLEIKAKATAELPECKTECSVILEGKTHEFNGKVAKVIIKDAKFVM